MAIDTSKTNSASIVKTLQLGSGVDIQALAKGLSEAENQPRIDAIAKKKDAVETSVSGYGILATAIDSIKYSFESFKNKSSLSASSVNSSSTELLVSTSSSTLATAAHSLQVVTLAKPQVSFVAVDSASSTANLASLTVEGNELLTVGATPEELVAAINAADLGISASLVNRKQSSGGALVDDWGIVLQGDTGTANAFAVTANSAVVAPSQAAVDSRLNFNGIDVFRSSNLVDDLVEDVSIDLRNSTEGSTYAIRTLTDNAPLKAALQDLAVVYNEIMGVLDELGGPDSDDSEYAGVLNRDKSLLNGLRSQLRGLFTATSATAAGDYSSLRDLGFSFARDGSLELDTDTLDSALAAAPDDVTYMLTAGMDNQSKWAPAQVRGLALELSLQLSDLIASDGLLSQRSSSAEKQVAAYEDQLALLEARLQKSYEKYVAQFAVMESFVERSQGIGKYLEGQFKSMQNMYDN
jgi:flagellar hook-associated protein 2